MKLKVEHIAILILVGVILYLRMCGSKCPPAQEVVKHFRDTTYVHVQDTINNYIPKITKVIQPVNIYHTDSVIILQHIDTQAVLHDYYVTRYYSDTAGTEFGDIVVQDSISQNRITSRRWITDFSIPIIKDCVVVADKKRNQIYIGGGVMGSPTSLISGFEADFTLRNKREQEYYLGGSILTKGDYYFRIGTRFKISFRK